MVFCAPASQAATIRFEDLNAFPQAPAYDVIVVGGDAEGIAAAVSAARAGARTLLVDTRPVPGGLLTRGWLNTIDLNLDASRKPLNGGLFGEIFRQLDDHSFDVAHMERLLKAMIGSERSLDYLPEVAGVLPVIGTASRPLYQPGQTLNPDHGSLPERLLTNVPPEPASESHPIKLSGIEIHTASEQALIVRAAAFVDATQDADLAVAAGAGFVRYGEDIWGSPRNMAVTLVFRLTGITDGDWSAMCAELARQPGAGDLLGGSKRSIWGFGEIMQEYQPTSSRIRMRALNIGRQNDGSVLINALLMFGVDGLSRESRLEGRRLAESELPHLVRFLNRRIVGMSRAIVAGTASECYVRTSRQIVTRYRLTVDDVLENRDFPDRIGFGSYPLDVQAQSATQSGDVTGKPEQYAVPLRCLIPRGFTNLLVVGRSAGFDSLAQSSARTIPVGMAAGQAAGIAAWVSLQRKTTIDQLADNADLVREVQRQLEAQGVRLSPNPAQAPSVTSHWAYAGLKFMRRRGMASGGYENAWGLDERMSGTAFVNRLVHLRPELDQTARRALYNLASGSTPLTLGRACLLITHADQLAQTSAETPTILGAQAEKTSFEHCLKRRLFAPPWPEDLVSADTPISRGAGYLLLYRQTIR